MDGDAGCNGGSAHKPSNGETHEVERARVGGSMVPSSLPHHDAAVASPSRLLALRSAAAPSRQIRSYASLPRGDPLLSSEEEERQGRRRRRAGVPAAAAASSERGARGGGFGGGRGTRWRELGFGRLGCREYGGLRVHSHKRRGFFCKMREKRDVALLFLNTSPDIAVARWRRGKSL